MAVDDSSVPRLSYVEYRNGFYVKALVQSIVKPGYHQNDLDLAFANIKSINPNARFVSLPYISSKVEITKEFMPIIESSDCNHLAGNVDDDQTCFLTVSHKGKRIIESALKSSGGIALNFIYKIYGVVENADGKYESREFEFGVSGSIGGKIMESYPNQFIYW
jgi:hypothetical protein